MLLQGRLVNVGHEIDIEECSLGLHRCERALGPTGCQLGSWDDLKEEDKDEGNDIRLTSWLNG